MGKKSLKPPSLPLLGTAPHVFPRDQTLQLSHDLLRTLLLRRPPGTSPGGPPPRTQASQAPPRSQPGLPLSPALALGCACPARHDGPHWPWYSAAVCRRQSEVVDRGDSVLG